MAQAVESLRQDEIAIIRELVARDGLSGTAKRMRVSVQTVAKVAAGFKVSRLAAMHVRAQLGTDRQEEVGDKP